VSGNFRVRDGVAGPVVILAHPGFTGRTRKFAKMRCWRRWTASREAAKDAKNGAGDWKTSRPSR